MPRRSLLCIIVALGCWFQGSTALHAEPALVVYFPLAVGNRWVYESSESTEAMPVLESWEVTRQEEHTFVMRIKQPYVTTDGFEEFFVFTADGVRRLARETGAVPRLFLKTPPKAGESWQNEDGRYAVTAVDETATVPAGTFTHCVEVTHWSAGGKVTVVSLYAPGVGMVQREETFPIIGGLGGFETPQQGRTILRLKEWTVKSPEPLGPEPGTKNPGL
jgi:hypothetical protein